MTENTLRPRHVRRAALAVTALAAGATIALTACGTSSSDASAPAGSSSASATGSAGSHNAADAMFVQKMVPHHEQAVEMSDLLLAKQGIDPRVVSLAQEIKAAQGPEITTMKQWMSSWGVSADGGMDHAGMDHGSMSGMMSSDDMNRLQTAQGVDAARLFLDQMIEHHTGAISMAQNEIRSGKDAAAKQLAQSIVSTQQREIGTMKQLLPQL